MNLIFLTLGRITGIGGRGIYTDLIETTITPTAVWHIQIR